MVVLENPTPDVASAAVGLLDPRGPQIAFSVDANAVTGSAVAGVDETSACRVSASMKMVPKRYTNLHNWLSLGPVSAKQLKEAVVTSSPHFIRTLGTRVAISGPSIAPFHANLAVASVGPYHPTACHSPVSPPLFS